MHWQDLIDFKDSPHQKFLASKENFWQVIEDINSYIEDLFAKPPPGFTKDKDLLIGPDVRIDISARILGKAIIGARSQIKDGVLIRDGVVIGESCTVGHATEIKHSFILDRSNAAHLNYVGDSLVGNNVNIAAGVILANFKNGSSNPEVFVESDNKRTATGLQKLGALIGDGTKIGSNCVTDPGTILGKNIITYPLVPIRGTIPSDKILKYKPTLEIVDKE